LEANGATEQQKTLFLSRCDFLFDLKYISAYALHFLLILMEQCQKRGGVKQERTGSSNVYGKSGLNLERKTLYTAPLKARFCISLLRLWQKEMVSFTQLSITWKSKASFPICFI